MLIAKNYKVHRDAFEHDGILFTDGEVVTMHETRAAQAVEVGALSETDEDATDKTAPKSATAPESKADTTATKAAPVAKAPVKGKK